MAKGVNMMIIMILQMLIVIGLLIVYLIKGLTLALVNLVVSRLNNINPLPCCVTECNC